MGKLELKYIKSISLLSEEEYKRYHVLIPPLDDFWWLASSAAKDDEAMLVTDLNDLSYDFVNIPYSVRPSLKLADISGTGLMIGQNFMFGGIYWTVLSKTLALADESIGVAEFNDSDGLFDVKNKFESSSIKEMLDRWYLNSLKSESVVC